ncbi:MAG: hypothetical protein AMXMBFR68_12860 [Ignavibacteria bacterium]
MEFCNPQADMGPDWADFHMHNKVPGPQDYIRQPSEKHMRGTFADNQLRYTERTHPPLLALQHH